MNGEIEEIEDLIKVISTKHRICQRCGGRIFGREKSEAIDFTILKSKQLSQHIISLFIREDQCEICFGIVSKSLDLVDKLVNKLQDYEFSTLLIGIQYNKQLEASEEILQQFTKKFLSIKHELARELGIRITNQMEKTTSFTDPDINLNLVITKSFEIKFKIFIKPLYILGRYNKLVRTIPQTKWPCTSCKGKKCEKCNNSGKQYAESVEEIIAVPFLDVSQSNDESFHGAGREDIDALMLGFGRPFVLELKNPKLRNINLENLTNLLNKSEKIQVNNLRFVDKSIIKLIKSSSPNSKKKYRAIISLSSPINNAELLRLKEFGKNKTILDQRTPERVSHRRADLIRNKIIYNFKVEPKDETHIELEILAQGGAYIKEFISGDEGRTTPSISSVLNQKTYCKYLDVLFVEDNGLFD
jgi:tRNA pseudouridine synthase 10